MRAMAERRPTARAPATHQTAIAGCGTLAAEGGDDNVVAAHFHFTNDHFTGANVPTAGRPGNNIAVLALYRWNRGVAALAGALLLCAPTTVSGHSHFWRVTEIFSDSSGAVQFIEMCECCGSNTEGHLNSDFTFLDTDAKRYFFPSDIGTNPDVSANRCVLTASPAFATLPGAPTPDFVLDPGLLPFFFDPDGDTVVYGREIATYSTIPVPFGSVPTDGVTSLQLDFAGNPSTGVNDPTNFAGETGSIIATAAVHALPALGPWGAVALVAALGAANVVAARRRGASRP